MTLTEADKIVQAYGNALQKRAPGPEGMAKFESLLPCPHAKIKQAAFLRLAAAYESGSLSEQMLEAFRTSLMFLHKFVPDEKAAAINSGADAVAAKKFISQLTNYSALYEMDDFVQKLITFDHDESLFWQKVYSLIGLEFNPDKLGASSVATKNTPVHPKGCLGLLTLGSCLAIIGHLIS